jgi:hypothetical protein
VQPYLETLEDDFVNWMTPDDLLLTIGEPSDGSLLG